MNTASPNPYASPQAESLHEGKRQKFSEMSFKPLKSIFMHSSTIVTMSLIWAVVAAITLYCFINNPAFVMLLSARMGLELEGLRYGCLAISCLNVAAIIGCALRKTWGRVLGIIACVLLMLSANIFLFLFALLGLIALLAGGRLFGPERLKHSELKAEYTYRKKHKID